MSKTMIKTLGVVFSDFGGVAHMNFVTTPNAPCYLDLLKCLKRMVAHWQTDFREAWKLYHDNASSYCVFVVNGFPAGIDMTLVLQFQNNLYYETMPVKNYESET